MAIFSLMWLQSLLQKRMRHAVYIYLRVLELHIEREEGVEGMNAIVVHRDIYQS